MLPLPRGCLVDRVLAQSRADRQNGSPSQIGGFAQSDTDSLQGEAEFATLFVARGLYIVMLLAQDAVDKAMREILK